MDLILVSGVGGSGVSTVAAGIAHGLRDEGLTTAEFNSAVPAPLDRSSVWADATATFGIWLRTLGTAGLAPQEVNGLPGVNELVTGAMVASALADRDVDAVIWDLGTIREAGRTLQVLDSVPMLLDRLLTGSVADQLSAPDPAASVSAWYRLVTHLAQAREVINRSRSVLVGRESDAQALQQGLGVMRLFGSSPTAIVLNRESKSGSAARPGKSRRAREGQPQVLVDGCTHHQGGASARPAAADQFASVADHQARQRLPAHLSLAHRCAGASGPSWGRTVAGVRRRGSPIRAAAGIEALPARRWWDARW